MGFISKVELKKQLQDWALRSRVIMCVEKTLKR